VAEIIKASKYIKRKSLTIEEFIFANRCWLGKIGNGQNRIFRKGDKLVGNYYVVLIKRIKKK
jgi:hypothetical protein